MISVQEAQKAILDSLGPLAPERLGAVDAVGRVLAEDVVNSRALPAWDNSAMDGYAVRAADAVLGARLRVTDEIPAGCASQKVVEAGCAARIFTGAPMPPGADSVLMQEDARREGDTVEVTEAVRAGQHVRRRATDARVGETVLRAGRVLSSGDVGFLASQGRSAVRVHRAPVVAIASSGDELIDVDGGEPGPGQIVNSNALALAAAVRAVGGVPRVLPIIPDDYEATERALKAASRADVLLTSGGVSVGDYDFVGRALNELSQSSRPQSPAGLGFVFWKVAIKPGKPLSFGHIGQCATFGLPGNPVSALVTFEVFVRPALLRMLGHRRVLRRGQPARVACDLKAGKGRAEYQRADAWFENGVLNVDPSRTQSSGALSSIAAADVLLRRPPNAPAVAAGGEVEVVLLGPDGPATRLEPQF